MSGFHLVILKQIFFSWLFTTSVVDEVIDASFVLDEKSCHVLGQGHDKAMKVVSNLRPGTFFVCQVVIMWFQPHLGQSHLILFTVERISSPEKNTQWSQKLGQELVSKEMRVRVPRPPRSSKGTTWREVYSCRLTSVWPLHLEIILDTGLHLEKKNVWAYLW